MYMCVCELTGGLWYCWVIVPLVPLTWSKMNGLSHHYDFSGCWREKIRVIGSIAEHNWFIMHQPGKQRIALHMDEQWQGRLEVNKRGLWGLHEIRVGSEAECAIIGQRFSSLWLAGEQKRQTRWNPKLAIKKRKRLTHLLGCWGISCVVWWPQAVCRQTKHHSRWLAEKYILWMKSKFLRN